MAEKKSIEEHGLGKFSLFSVDSSDGDIVEQVDVDEITEFQDHPFRVVDDEEMEALVTSIKENGILTPVLLYEDRALARPLRYRLISGHRRVHAAKQAGLTEVPAIIKEVDRDTAIVMMVDANRQRENLLPSERAKAFKMKFEAMKRQGRRPEGIADGGRTTEQMGKEESISKNTVSRYIRLTYLVDELMELVDSKKIGIVDGVELSFLPEAVQEMLAQYISERKMISAAQIKTLREWADADKIKGMEDLLACLEKKGKKSEKASVAFSAKELSGYFPKDEYKTAEDRKRIIVKLLEMWREGEIAIDEE